MRRWEIACILARLSFQPMWPGWLPEGLVEENGTDLSDLPGAIRYVYSLPDSGETRLFVETSQGARDDLAGFSEASRREMTVQGQAGVCVQGILDDPGDGSGEVEASELAWSADGLIYRIRALNLGLTCEDLLRVAGE